MSIATVPLRIECQPEVLERIRLEVIDAFFAIPRGGLEVGGVLFGRQRNGVVSIEASRPVECEHASGPGFVLSERDRERLAEGIAARDLELRDLIPVGWYRSRTRSDIQVGEWDLEICRTYFAEPWHVLLVLRPEVTRPLRAAYFTRGSDGELSGGEEFEVLPAKKRALAAPEHREVIPDVVAAAPDRRRQIWAFCAFLLLCVLSLGALQFWRSPTSGADPLPLTVTDRDGSLEIRWDRKAEAIRKAASATMEITDGEMYSRVDLDRGHLQRGALFYARMAHRVDLRLTLRMPDQSFQEVYALFVRGGPP
jgi:hypothetical protein